MIDEQGGKTILEPESVASITESPYRTPIAIETKMYEPEFHEVYMSAPLLCKVILDDGSEYLLERSSWETEFIVLPDDRPNRRISDVVPVDYTADFHRLKDVKRDLPDPNVMYCIFKR